MCDEFYCNDIIFLFNLVSMGNGLLFGSGVLLGVENEDVVSGGKV